MTIDIEENNSINQETIGHYLDIQSPFLMIDTFTLEKIGKRATSTLFIPENAWYIDCHLPGEQVMPATLVTESMLQSLVLLIYCSIEHGKNKAFITDIKVKMKIAVKPADTILHQVEIISSKRGITKGKVISYVKDNMVCQGEFSYASPHLMHMPLGFS